MTSTYITTTIPYVNARPHLGFALELVQADVLARYHRSVGEQVRLQAGTDDNALKNVLAAAAAGTRPWDLAKAGDRVELAAVLSALLRACQAIGEHLRPFLPDAATRITRQCATDATGLLPGPAPILPRITEPVPAERPAARRGIQVN